MLRIVLFGPQGSGKGTQGQLIKKRFGIPHLSMGELLRAEAKDPGELGQKINSLLAQGELINDDITNELIKKSIFRQTPVQGFILDGYPRRLAQAEFLDSIINIDVALELVLSDAEAIERLGNRLTCANCGWVYNIQTNPPLTIERCDHCQAILKQRSDDNPVAIKQRLSTYRQLAQELIDFYQSKDIYRSVSASGSIEEVFGKVVDVLALR
jgi:adenylate kinase